MKSLIERLPKYIIHDNIGYATNFNKALKMLRNYIKCQEKSKVNIVEI